MAPALGKRKRVAAEVPEKRSKVAEESEQESEGEEIDAQEIFRRHFEAQFKPLPEVKKTAKPEESVSEPEDLSEDEDEDEEEDEDEVGSDWDGISGEEDEGNQVEVVEHTKVLSRANMSKEELKKFMSSKVPSSTPSTTSITKARLAAKDDEDTSEAGNLKKDLELQRLLTESHLLDNSTNLTLVGKNRHKATDLRMQALGSKTSIFEQKSMPASHRRGMVAKAGEREHKRRTEARENGIILERAKSTKKFEGKRERGVGAPGVGKFSGGTLKLSKQDIADIEGPKRSSSGRGGRGGGGRGRGGKGKRGGR